MATKKKISPTGSGPSGRHTMPKFDFLAPQALIDEINEAVAHSSHPHRLSWMREAAREKIDREKK